MDAQPRVPAPPLAQSESAGVQPATTAVRAKAARSPAAVPPAWLPSGSRGRQPHLGAERLVAQQRVRHQRPPSRRPGRRAPVGWGTPLPEPLPAAVAPPPARHSCGSPARARAAGLPPPMVRRGSKDQPNQEQAHIYVLLHLPLRAYAISAQAEAEEHQFEKRSLGGSCFEATPTKPFEEPCPRMKPRGRDWIFCSI